MVMMKLTGGANLKSGGAPRDERFPRIALQPPRHGHEAELRQQPFQSRQSLREATVVPDPRQPRHRHARLARIHLPRMDVEHPRASVSSMLEHRAPRERI